VVVARPGDVSDVAIEPEVRVERHAERLQLGCDPQRAAICLLVILCVLSVMMEHA